MAEQNVTISELTDASLPLLGTDKTIVSRNGTTLNDVTLANLPISTPVQTALDDKQDTLVSGTNIKTINGETVLGNGDITVSGGSSSFADLIGEPTDNTALSAALDAKLDADLTITALTSSRSTTATDDLADLENSTSNDYTLAIEQDTVPNGLSVTQASIGKCILTAGTGVTLLGNILTTANSGDILVVRKTGTANTYRVYLSYDAIPPLLAQTTRTIANSDNGRTLVPSDNAQTFTVNTGLISGFSCFINNNATITAGAGVTVNDKRTSGATNPTFAIVNTGAETYALIGSKT